MLIGSKMKRAVTAFCVTHHGSLPLGKESFKWHFSSCKHCQISVHGKYIFIRMKCSGNTGGNCFLANATEPFADSVLAQQHQHLFLNHPRKQNSFVKISERFSGVVFSDKIHGGYG